MSSIRKNFAANVYQSILLIIGQIALVPLFVRGWGSPLYGEWLVLFAIPSYLSLSDLGIVNALGNQFVIDYSSGRETRAFSIFGAVFRFQGYINLAIVSGVVLCGIGLPIRRLLVLQQMTDLQCSLVIAALTVYTGISIQSSTFSAIYRAAGRFHSYLIIQGHFRFLEIIASAAVLWLRGSPVSLALAMLSIRCAMFGVLLWHAKRVGLGRCIGFAAGDWSDFRGLIPTGLGFFLIPVGSSLANQATTLVVNWLGGASTVVVLNVVRQLSRVFQQLSLNASNAIRPEFTRAYAKGDVERMRRMQFGGLALIGLLATPFLVGIYWFGPSVILWWARGLEVSSRTAVLFGIESVLAALAYTGTIGAWASNRVRGVGVGFVITQAAAVSSAALLYSRLGIDGVAVTFAIGNLFYLGITVYESLQCIRPHPVTCSSGG